MDEEFKELLERYVIENEKRNVRLDEFIRNRKNTPNTNTFFNDRRGGTTWSTLGTNIGEVAGDLISKSLTAGITQTGRLAQKEQVGVSTVAEATKGALGMVSELFTSNSPATILNEMLQGAHFIGEQIIYQFEQESQLLTEINEKAGITGELSKDLRSEIFKAYPGIVNMGYGLEEVSKFYTELIEDTGKFTMLNNQNLTTTAEVARAFVGDLDKMAQVFSEFERVGMGAATALDMIEEAGVESLALGLRSKKTVEDIGKNIDKLNQYGFDRGVQGLAEMSRKATEFRMNMEDTFTIAEKVINPEGAVELSANLQVIGGAIGEFADPLKLMYMATNNVEGLQDALIGAADGLATYNDEQGRFEVTGANLRRARDMAQALGVSLNDLSRTAVAAQERARAASDLLSTGLRMTDEDREFLTNLGTMKDGTMTIQVPESIAEKIGLKDTEVAMSYMTASLAKNLLENREAFQEMDSKEIAQNQLTELGKMERHLNTIAAAARVQIAQYIKGTDIYKGGEGMLEQVNKITGGLADNMIERNITFRSEEGKENYAVIENMFGEKLATKISENVDKLMTKSNETLNVPQTQTTPQNSTMQINVNHSATQMPDAVGKAMFTNDYLKSLMQDKRSFTNNEHFW